MTEEREQLLADLMIKNPTWRSVLLSRHSGIPLSSVKRYLNRQTNKKYDIEDGYKLKGKSVYTDGDGNIKAQWIKTAEDRETLLERLKLAAEAIVEPVRGEFEPTTAPEETNEDLLSVYPIADVHMGLYAWAKESGEDWSAKKAENALNRGMEFLVDASPSSETCLIANLADFFHTDTSDNKTARSGHVLDVDTRWAKVFQIGVRCYRNMITLALSKHKKVIVKSGIGNHDDHSILSLAMLMKAYFENEPRVEIELPISPFAYHVFGSTLLGINHGDIKADKLPLIMAHDCRKEWGKTKHAHWLVGHIHHKTMNEYPGVVVESFRQPGAKDAWSHGMGYRAERDMQLIVFHKDKGEISRVRTSTEL